MKFACGYEKINLGKNMQTLLDVINDSLKTDITKKTKKQSTKIGDIFSTLLNSLNAENTDEFSVSKIVLDKNEINFKKTDIKKNINSDIFKINKSKNLFEASNFLQILNILEVLNGGKINKFPILNSKMTEFFSVEKNILEIKGAKNITELIKISQKFNLGLEKINITKDLTNRFEKEFKELTKKNFFKLENNLNFNEMTKAKINQISKTKSKPDETNLPKLLANLENKNTDKKTLNLISQPKNDKSLEIKNQTNLTNKELNLEQISKKEILKNDVKNEIKFDKTLNFDKNLKQDENINKITPKLVENSQKTGILNEKIPQENAQIKDNITKKEHTQIKLDIPKDDVLKMVLNPTTQNENNKEQQTSQNNSKDNEIEHFIIKDIVKNAQNQMKNIEVKKTFESFSTSLKEQVQNYKPPIMRVNLVLNPEKLGEVEITIVNRGNNLHINFNSTPQTMNLFLQNQTEFKASLVNMGFGELQMNFSDQQQNKDQTQNSKKFKYVRNGESTEETEQNLLELIIPRYI